MKKTAWVFLGLSFILFACKKETTITCDFPVEMVSMLNPADTLINYSITNAVINENCLSVTFKAGGCDGSEWKYKMVSDSIFIDTFPVQKKLVLKLENNEDCEALIVKTVSFDLTSLQVSHYNTFNLRLLGWSAPLVYNY